MAAESKSERAWRHHACATWTFLSRGAQLALEAEIGAYLLVRRGEVEVESQTGTRRTAAPDRVPVGGGRVQVTAITDAAFALGTAFSSVAIAVDADAGLVTELWTTLGRNRRPLRALRYER